MPIVPPLDHISCAYRCPKCYLRFIGPDKILEPDRVYHDSYHDELCEYCSIERTEKETLERQLEILERTNINDFPKVVRNMYSQLKKLFEEEVKRLEERIVTIERKYMRAPTSEEMRLKNLSY